MFILKRKKGKKYFFNTNAINLTLRACQKNSRKEEQSLDMEDLGKLFAESQEIEMEEPEDNNAGEKYEKSKSKLSASGNESTKTPEERPTTETEGVQENTGRSGRTTTNDRVEGRKSSERPLEDEIKKEEIKTPESKKESNNGTEESE